MKRFIKNFKLNKTNNYNNYNRIKLFYVYAIIYCKKNNTIITITKKNGNVLSWTTCSKAGYKNAKKSLPISAQKTAESIGKLLVKFNTKYVYIYLNGIGYGREPVIRGFYNSGLKIISIADITSIPHNGCRSKKLRRI